jgi:hypothetical protein
MRPPDTVNKQFVRQKLYFDGKPFNKKLIELLLNST